MFSKLLKGYNPKRILVISQTNIGDVVLTCPAIDILRRDFPSSPIDVVVGPKAISLFSGNPDIGVKVFNKRGTIPQTVRWFFNLFGMHYDCVVDLRHTMLPLFLMPRFSTPILFKNPAQGHKRQMHLNRLAQVHAFDALPEKRFTVAISPHIRKFIDSHLQPFLQKRPFMVIAPGSADSSKRWEPEKFAVAADHIAQTTRIVFVGDDKDALIIEEIRRRMRYASLSLSMAGKTDLIQLACILQQCSWALVHDSGVMHLASYLDVPIVVLWGPSPLERYAPWSRKSIVVRRNQKCRRCQDSKSKENHACMSFIQVEDVMEAIKEIQ